MKKSIKFILSIFICLLVVGSGFSAWYFSNTDFGPSNHNITGTISVAPIAGEFSTELVISTTGASATDLYSSKTDGTTKAVSALNLTLDQGSDASDLSQLIYFGGDSETAILNLSIVLKISAPKATGGTETERATADTTTAGKINALNPTVTLTKTLSETLDDYVAFNESAVLSAAANSAATTEGATIERTITYTLPLSFKYVTGMKPQTAEAYNEMVTALASANYNLRFDVAYGA